MNEKITNQKVLIDNCTINNYPHNLIKDIAKLLWESYTPYVAKIMLPVGFELITTTDSIKQNFNIYGLKGIVAQNKINNSIYIAFAGTDLYDYRDILDDIRIFCSQLPSYKINAIKYFINYVVHNVVTEEKFFEKNIVCCGHSLGAILAEIATLFINRVYSEYNNTKSTCKIQTITIENPGADKLLKTLISQNMFDDLSNNDLELLSYNSYTYNGKRNFVNGSGEQFAKNVYLQIDIWNGNNFEESICDSLNSLKKDINGHNILSYCLSHITEITTIFYKSIYWPIKKYQQFTMLVEEFLENHGLSRFINCENSYLFPVEQFNAPNKQIFISSDVLPALSNVKKQGTDIAILFQEKIVGTDINPEGFVYVELFECSYSDLSLIGVNNANSG